MSITGDFGGMVMQCAERLLRHRLVHIIASDAHSSDSCPPVLSQAVEAAAEILGNYDDAERMVKEVPALILSGGVPDIPQPKRAKRGIV
jgi:protein-tyrosine phosphatase